jgi:FKBP-type peptidyl-prolyl cis-trans isomerase SlyD
MTDQIIQPGKYVALTYVIEDQHGHVVEQHDLPLGFVYGSDTELIGGMDRAVAGMRVGSQVEARLSSEQGFGAHDPSLTFVDDMENVPPQYHRVGAAFQLQDHNGDMRSFHVTRIEDGRITVDGNHPLAGKDLTIRVTIAEVRDARPGEDRRSGIHAVQFQGSSTIN